MPRLHLLLAHLAVASVKQRAESAACGGDDNGNTCSGVFIQRHGTLTHDELASHSTQSSCNEVDWPDKDEDIDCGDCRALVVKLDTLYNSCSQYCHAIGRRCNGAWKHPWHVHQEKCDFSHPIQCEETPGAPTAICECSTEVTVEATDTDSASVESCWGEHDLIVEEEGMGVGQADTKDIDACKKGCADNDQCNSVSFCPQWSGCWFKDKVLTGAESTRQNGDCKSIYKTPCGGGVTPRPSPAPTTTEALTTTKGTTTKATTTTRAPTTTQDTDSDCFGSFEGIVEVEGPGVASVGTTSADVCKEECMTNADCNSFSLCPQWGTCWLKSKTLTGSEAWKVNGECRSFYKRACGGSTTETPTPRPTPRPTPHPTTNPTAAPTAGTQPSEDMDCYGEMSTVAADEGLGVGDTSTRDLDVCKAFCDGNAQCNSFAFCPDYSGCWLKSKVLEGNEATKVAGTCRTYYKMPCWKTPAPTVAPTFAPRTGNSMKVTSYNIYWWNAFGQNPWKGEHVTDNIKNHIQADVIGLQECDNPQLITDRTGYIKASDFAGAQGIMVKPGLFSVGESGHRDIQATGKWGPRYVTWVQLTINGFTFWVFNTHWCVHSDSRHTCSADKRYTGAKNMLDVIVEKATGGPAIITGDFNAAMGEQGPQHFVQNGFRLIVNNWVDAIFVSEGHWNTVSTSTGNPAYSDHPPVIAELEF